MPNPISQFRGMLYQRSAPSGAVSTTPPTFAGITSATPNTDGSITASWALATSLKTPVEYLIYVSTGAVSAAALFGNPLNDSAHIPANKTSGKIFLLADQSTYLVKDSQYTIGVRARDAYGFTDSNMIVQVVTAIASGNLPSLLNSILQSAIGLEADIALDAASIDASASNLDALELAIAADAASIDASATSLAASASGFGAISSALSASAGTQMSFSNLETVMTIDSDGVN